MFEKLKKWFIDDDPCDIDVLKDKAYADGARQERQEILDILDRLNVQYAEVYNSVARQAREEIASRGR